MFSTILDILSSQTKNPRFKDKLNTAWFNFPLKVGLSMLIRQLKSAFIASLFTPPNLGYFTIISLLYTSG